MENDLEVFMSTSDLSSHASVPPATPLSASYALGAGLSTRDIKNEFISVTLSISGLWGKDWGKWINNLSVFVLCFFNNLEMSKLLWENRPGSHW